MSREFILTAMVHADFSAGEITLASMQNDFRIGKGLYLVVSVNDAQDAENCKSRITNSPHEE